MKIAFYSPLKPADHAVPSGDRLMARLLMAALRLCGHEVAVASRLTSFTRVPDAEAARELSAAASREIEAIDARWRQAGGPDLWFCYHPYYKAADLLGPALAKRFGLAYVTAEASYSAKRDAMGWAGAQAALLDDLRFASVNICFTARDRDGLRAAEPRLECAMLAPFIDTALFKERTPAPVPARLTTVAMMRAGDKLSSYRALGASLALLPRHLPWRLDIIGDGPERQAVREIFSAFSERIVWHGQQSAQDIAAILAGASLYLWPGHGEAYGLAYLEAQAAGLPVVAERLAGVPEVVMDGKTGLLTAPGDAKAYADAIARLLDDDALRHKLAAGARHFVLTERSLPRAAARLDAILQTLPEKKPS